MATMTRAPRRADDAKQRRLRTSRERLEHEQRRAPRCLQALEQARLDLGRPETLAAEVEWCLQAHGTRLGHIFGLMVPPRVGCRTASELTPRRVGDQHLPSRILGALPTPQWLRRRQRRGQALWIRRWQQVEAQSPATRRRWPWRWVGDARVVQQSGPQLGLVGPWDSGPEHGVRLGREGRLREVVRGAGQLVVPVDVGVRRPDPVGPGRPGREQLTGLPVRRDRPWAVRPRRCRRRPAPWVVAARGVGDAAWLAPIQRPQPATVGVAGTRRSVFVRPEGRRVKGQERVPQPDWPWRDRLQVPGRRSARCPATRATDGRLPRVLVDKPGAARCSVWCRQTTLAAPRLSRAWHRRRGMEPTCRPLTHRWAAEAGQVQTADADDGPRVWRWLAGLVRRDTGRFRLKGRVPRAALVCSLTHPWRVLTAEARAFQARSWDLSLEAACIFPGAIQRKSQMTFPVLVGPCDGQFVASLVGVPNVRVVGPTRSQAIDALKAEIEYRVALREPLSSDIEMIGVSSLAGKYDTDSTLRTICDDAYQACNAEQGQ